MAKNDANTVVVSSGNGLNLRKGPGCEFEVISVLKDGAKLALIELPEKLAVPGWLPVKAGKNTGWVMSKFVAASGPAVDGDA